MKNVAVLGLGVVGGGVYEILTNEKQLINNKLKLDYNLKYGLVKEITPDLIESFNKVQLVDDVKTILNDDTIDIVIEVMGGIDFSYQVIKEALSKKKSVISANKDLIAKHGYELRKLALENKVDFYYEASVAGTIPVINVLNNSLCVDEISSFSGILNGTSNFILSKMSNDKLSYEDALILAQELGFAESDPTADVKGLDAMRKVAILSSLSFNTKVDIDNIYVEGIDLVKEEDIKVAQANNYSIKLIGQGLLNDGKITHKVMPTFVSNNHPLATINNEINAITINSKYSNSISLSGPGAGSLPTANAIVADFVKVLTNIKFDSLGYQVHLEEYNYPFNENFNVETIIINHNTNEIKYENLDLNSIKELKNQGLSVYEILK